MTIFLDSQIFNLQRYGGISRYHAEVWRELNQKKGVTVKSSLIYSESFYLKEFQLHKKHFQAIESLQFKGKGRIASLFYKWNNHRDYQLVKKGAFDVFVPTYYDTYYLDIIGRKPFVLTIYDMIFELLPQYFSENNFLIKRKKILIERATKIIAISESTKKDILQLYPEISPEKIDVVHLSHSITDTQRNTLKDLPTDYMLFVGNRGGYKNFKFFIGAVVGLLKKYPELTVISAGGGKFTKDEKNYLRELDIAEKVTQRNFEETELPEFYRKALCFVFPSEYEGFGIPVLEAMACQCPVVLANHSSFPEVAGDAGIYFENKNAIDLAEKIENIILNASARKKYILLGNEQHKKFSWEKTANNCLKVYQSVV